MNSWIVYKSKSRSGREYAFNPKTSQSVWLVKGKKLDMNGSNFPPNADSTWLNDDYNDIIASIDTTTKEKNTFTKNELSFISILKSDIDINRNMEHKRQNEVNRRRDQADKDRSNITQIEIDRRAVQSKRDSFKYSTKKKFHDGTISKIHGLTQFLSSSKFNHNKY